MLLYVIVFFIVLLWKLAILYDVEGKMKFEAGPFHSFGREILQQLDDIYYELKGKIHNG